VSLLAALLMLLPSAPPLYAASGTETYTFSVFPYQAPRLIETLYSKPTNDFQATLGKKVFFETKSNFGDWFEQVKNQSYDIVLIQPFFYTEAYAKYSYLPVARNGEDLHGVFVTKPGTEINSLNDLRGLKIALPPQSAAVSYLAKLAFEKIGFDLKKDIEFSYQRNHDACLQRVIIGDVAACVTAPTVVRQFEHRRNIKLNRLARTPVIPHILFAVHARVPATHRRLILKTILSWGSTDEGRKFLMKSGLKEFLPTTNDDYDIVRELKKKF
jgi:ABC-type phosphate/phosphonate transport system substrate-binding protein